MNEKNEMIFGVRAVIEAIGAGKTVERIFIKNDTSGELSRELLALARERAVPVIRVPLEKLNRLTRKNHQGVVAFISPVAYQDLEEVVTRVFEEGRVPALVLLDGVTDTRNFGAIARTADCAGFDAVVIPERGSAGVTPEAVKASAGALFRIPVCRVRNMLDAVRLLRQLGLSVVGASEKTDSSYTQADFSLPSAIVMGAEDVGISPQVVRACDSLVSIPMLGDISSLNVSVAAGVLMYELVRQRSLSDS